MDKGILRLEKLYEAVVSENGSENIAGAPFFRSDGDGGANHATK